LSGTLATNGGTIVEDGTLILATSDAVLDGSSLTVGADAYSILGPLVAGTPVLSLAGSPVPEHLSVFGDGGSTTGTHRSHCPPYRNAKRRGAEGRRAELPSTRISAVDFSRKSRPGFQEGRPVDMAARERRERNDRTEENAAPSFLCGLLRQVHFPALSSPITSNTRLRIVSRRDWSSILLFSWSVT
jgi:hypothetical protein